MRAFRITRTRVISQAFFSGLFLFLVFVTWFSRLKGYPVSLFLEIDPLVGMATAISTHTLYRHLAWSLALIVPTLLLGRFFCNWICPFGTLHQFMGWLFNTRRDLDRVAINRYRPMFQLKYILLIVFIVLASFGALQIGLLDPLCILTRTFATTVTPATDLAVEHGAGALETRGMASGRLRTWAFSPGAAEQRIFYGAWFVGAVFLALVGMNLAIPRFFCRALCPLGACLGVLSRFSLWRIDRDLTRCTDCNLCLAHCEGASAPHAALRKSECFVCFNCLDDCPEDALSFRFMPVSKHRPREGRLFGNPVISKAPDTEVAWPALSRRRLLLTAAAGALAYPFLRLSAAVNPRAFDRKAIRPPGSVEENEFLERCIKCGQCMKVCPTNVLQPATLTQAGLEGLWTPVMDMTIGFCQLNCVLCSDVCPTGAIRKISIGRKLGVGQHAADGPISVGTAFVNQGRCLPWAMETPCVVCEEVCPISPKAIGTYDAQIKRWDGTRVTLKRPYVRPELCTGCGICQHECPVLDEPAVAVTAIGETRSKNRSLLLRSRHT
ncbi:MAG: 4Fe-4S dicluster domain-containing protein [Lentisphaerae bacterium]|nr:4Fe-4S dicluster domain-containing protein [Lentisphaerota bacterium]